MRFHKLKYLIVLFGPVLLQIVPVHAADQTYFVNISGDDTNSGRSESEALGTIRRATELAGPGDTVLILPGIYDEVIRPDNSGNKNEGHITYLGGGLTPGEVVISHLSDDSDFAGVIIDQHSYIRIENIISEGNFAYGIWVFAPKGNPVSHIEILDCIIRGNGNRQAAWGRTGIRTQYVNDMLIQDCLVEGNHGGGLLIYDGSGIVINRCKVINNRGSQPFTYTADDYDGVCIQSCSNVVIRDVEAAYNGEDGIDIGLYEDPDHLKDNKNFYIESCIAHHNSKKGICISNSHEYSDGWRVQNVTIAKCLSFYNGKAGIEIYQYARDQRIAHNTVISQSFGNSERDSQYDCGINIERAGVDSVFVKNNISAFHKSLNFSARKANEGAEIHGYHNFWSEALLNTLNYNMSGDITGDPLFTDSGSIYDYPDLNLAAGSPAINAGAPLALTRGHGINADTLNLDDSKWFTDGLGVLDGSTIRIGDQTARVKKILDKHTLVTDPGLTWIEGEGITFEYLGSGPDIGALEYGQTVDYIKGLSCIPPFPENYNPATWPFSAPELRPNK